MTDEKYTAKELEEMANALLTQDKSADKAKSAKPAVKAEKAAENPEKADDGKHPAASRGKLDEKAGTDPAKDRRALRHGARLLPHGSERQPLDLLSRLQRQHDRGCQRQAQIP